MMLNLEKEGKLYSFLRNAASFFDGKLYPFLVALMVLIGHITLLEFYFNTVIILAASLSLWVSRNVKPFLITMLSFLYQIPTAHSPAAYNTKGDPAYYGRVYIVVTVVILGVILFSSMAYRFFKLYAKKLNAGSPLILSLSILAAAFICNGIFSKEYSLAALAFGLVQAIVFFFFFYFIYYGLEDISASEMISYICYLSLLLLMILAGEMANLYLTSEHAINDEGQIIKEHLNLGWGVSNQVGFATASLIPMLVYGAMTEKRKYLYLISALGAWVLTCLTLSRNAILFSSLAVFALAIFACFFGQRKKFFRIAALVAIAVFILFAVIFFDKIYSLLSNFLGRDTVTGGNVDNGRFSLWKIAIQNFLSYPIFGIGFFGYGAGVLNKYDYQGINVVPPMPHQTFLTLLAIMGIVGLLAYLFYRINTILPLLKRPSVPKSAMLIAMLTILSMGLLDNYVFYGYTMFYYTVILVASQKLVKEENEPTEDAEIPCEPKSD